MIKQYLLTVQVACLVIAAFLVLLQNRGAGLSSTFGGKDEIYLTKRGIEKTVTQLTVFFVTVYVILRIVDFYLA
jgi:protein translocase SecG subunit